jgi:hypothetical protein
VNLSLRLAKSAVLRAPVEAAGFRVVARHGTDRRQPFAADSRFIIRILERKR